VRLFSWYLLARSELSHLTVEAMARRKMVRVSILVDGSFLSMALGDGDYKGEWRWMLEVDAGTGC